MTDAKGGSKEKKRYHFYNYLIVSDIMIQGINGAISIGQHGWLNWLVVEIRIAFLIIITYRRRRGAAVQRGDHFFFQF